MINVLISFKENRIIDLGSDFRAGNPITFLLKPRDSKEVLLDYSDIYLEVVRHGNKKTIQRSNIEVFGGLEPEVKIECRDSIIYSAGHSQARLVVIKQGKIYRSSEFTYSISGPYSGVQDNDIEAFAPLNPLVYEPQSVSGGTQWFDGVGLPPSETGLDGDYYFQIDNADIFKKVVGIWNRVGNIKGSKGDTGEIGPKGQDGYNGSKWLDGVGLPTVETGVDGDYYINIENADIFSKINGSWERVGSIAKSLSLHQDYYTKAEIDEKLLDVVRTDNGSIVIKGNLYTTKDGIRPPHFGPPTKDAGNVLMPYARAVGGFTKDGSGVRTIGFVAKPIDIFESLNVLAEPEPNIDSMTAEEMDIDSVFLGTNVSQLFLYSKQKYPTIVSEGTRSPIATQEWVISLVNGLDLNAGEQQHELISTSVPSELFDTALTNSLYTGNGEYQLNDETKQLLSRNQVSTDRTPVLAREQYNDINFVIHDGAQIVGLWRNSEQIYCVRFMGKTLDSYYWNYDGSFKAISTSSLPIGTSLGARVRLIYDNKLESWVVYQVDANENHTLVTKVSKYLFSGSPGFINEDTIPVFSPITFNTGTSFTADITLIDAPSEAPQEFI